MDVIPLRAMGATDLQRYILSEKKTKTNLRAEELRERIDAEATIRSLLDLVQDASDCPIAELPRLQFKAMILTTILRKVMPDLKALEISEKQQNKTALIIDMKQ